MFCGVLLSCVYFRRVSFCVSHISHISHIYITVTLTIVGESVMWWRRRHCLFVVCREEGGELFKVEVFVYFSVFFFVYFSFFSSIFLVLPLEGELLICFTMAVRHQGII